MILDDILMKKHSFVDYLIELYLVLVFDFWCDPTEYQFMGRVVFVDVYVYGCCRLIEASTRTQNFLYCPFYIFLHFQLDKLVERFMGWIAVYPSVFNGPLSSNF